MQEGKACVKCGLQKSHDNFYELRNRRNNICKICWNKQRKEWVLANPEKVRAKRLAYRADPLNRAKEKQYAQRPEVKARNREAAKRYNHTPERKKYYRQWLLANWEDQAAKKRARRKKLTSEQMAAYTATRRARKRATTGEHYTPADVADLRKKQRGKCAICKAKLTKNAHVDHITPLAKGGSNSKRNIQLTCPVCNIRKNARDPIDHMQSLGFLL